MMSPEHAPSSVEPARVELVDVSLGHPRGGEPLVLEANLKVDRGEVVLIVGAAGVGTSRLVAALLGEVPASAGRIDVFGRDVGKLRRSSLRLLRRRVGIVPQELCLLEDRSAELNVVLPLEIDGIPRSISVLRASEALERLGMPTDASCPVACLSGAARQRVAVARALVRGPELLVADHPTSRQDAEGAELVCSALAEEAARGAAVVVFGRDPALRAIAERRGWRQLCLVGGRLLPLADLALEGRTGSLEHLLFGDEPVLEDELSIDLESAPTPIRPVTQDDDDDDNAIPNLVQFPSQARPAPGPVGARKAGVA